jgi:CDP-glycerol glycerophosphotransferase
MFVETYGFQDVEVNVTGFSRFDQLSTENNNTINNKILIATTWRKWLKRGNRLYSSKYFYYWSQLIKSQRLSELLEKHDAFIYFQPHFNMMKFVNEFAGMSKRIIIQTKDFPLQQHIKECDMLITDYSSVMYDFYYQEKPVICYMFDRDEWEKQLDGPPLIDFEKDLPSDIVCSVDEVVDSLEEYMNIRFAMKNEHLPKIYNFIKNRDHNNCERIYQSILHSIENTPN